MKLKSRLLSVVAFGTFGVLLTALGYAATYSLPAEAETSALSGKVTMMPGTGASGNLALKFGATPTDLMFPVVSTKRAIKAVRPYGWCYGSQANCHHDYNAADIMIAEGTTVVAAYPGTVTKTTNIVGKNASINIIGDGNKNVYFYQHMAPGSLRVAEGAKVVRGTPLGKVGNRDAAFGTDPHLHFDILPPPHTSRVSCSGAACKGYPFINVQPALIAAFQNIPE